MMRGLLSPDAAMCSSNLCGASNLVVFSDAKDDLEQALLHTFAAEAVHRLRVEERCDLVLDLLHGGPLEARLRLAPRRDLDLQLVPRCDLSCARILAALDE